MILGLKPGEKYLYGGVPHLFPHILGAAILLLMPLFMSPFSLGIVAKAFSLAIFAMSLDILIGYTACCRAFYSFPNPSFPPAMVYHI